MFERIRKRVTTPAGAIAVVALILALGGTALAASGALTSKQKKEVEKIAKKFQGTGPAGAAGANGTNGINGAPGSTGAPGAPGAPGNTVLHGANPPQNTEGANGDFYLETNETKIWGPKAAGAWPATGTKLKGTNGNPGIDGKTVLNGTGAPNNANGHEGDFYIDTAAHVIYGPKGATTWPATGTSLEGPQGPPGLSGFTAHLPSGETEKGVWSLDVVNPSPPVSSTVLSPISFSIPLAAASPEAVFVPAEQTAELDEGDITEFEGCEGTLANPTAPQGKLCVYTEPGSSFIHTSGLPEVVGIEIEPEGGLEPGYGLSGAFVQVHVFAETQVARVVANGTWAVTAP